MGKASWKDWYLHSCKEECNIWCYLQPGTQNFLVQTRPW